VRVRGEISGFKRATSGHLYFALKDEEAKLDGVCWRGTAGRLAIAPEDGLEVIATGRISSYPGRSSYQLIIESLELAGEGALLKLLEERRKKLAAEGLFDPARKKALPFLPEVIGVVTSPTGAVIRDILHRLHDRFPRHVLIWPVLVQGEGAKDQIAAAIAGFNALAPGGKIPRPDLLIVARGGGSLEDLWAFNEEVVVRAAAASRIPLISAVGHETDTTLIDFAADMRAPTPTAAAEMAVPVRSELLVQVDSLARRSLACWQRGEEARRTELRAAMRALPAAEALLAVPRQRLDGAGDRLPRALIANARLHHTDYSRIAGRLTAQSVAGRIVRDRERAASFAMRVAHCMRVQGERRRDRFAAASVRLAAGLRANAEAQRVRIARARERVDGLMARAALAIDTLLDRRDAQLEHAAQLLTALSYHGVLARGFVLVRSEAGKPLRSAAAVSPGARVDIEFADGRVRAMAEVRDLTGPPSTRPARRRARRGDPDPGQGSLF